MRSECPYIVSVTHYVQSPLITTASYAYDGTEHASTVSSVFVSNRPVQTPNNTRAPVKLLRARFTESVASETAKQGLTQVPVSLHRAGRIGLLAKGVAKGVKFAGANFVVLAAMVSIKLDIRKRSWASTPPPVEFATEDTRKTLSQMCTGAPESSEDTPHFAHPTQRSLDRNSRTCSRGRRDACLG